MDGAIGRVPKTMTPTGVEQLFGDRPANAIFKARRQPAMIQSSLLHSRAPDGQTILASR
jgi:hypothetical protein